MYITKFTNFGFFPLKKMWAEMFFLALGAKFFFSISDKLFKGIGSIKQNHRITEW